MSPLLNSNSATDIAVRRRIELKNNPKFKMRPSLQKLIRKKKVLLIEMNEKSLRQYMQFVKRADAQESED